MDYPITFFGRRREEKKPDETTAVTHINKIPPLTSGESLPRKISHEILFA